MYCTIAKRFDDERIIAGYASVEIIDSQGDMIPLKTIGDAWDKFSMDWNNALVQVLHSNINVGRVIPYHTDSEGRTWKSGLDDTGLFVVVKLRTDIKRANDVWDLVVDGTLRGFSIGGEALVKVTICNTAGKCYDQIDQLELHEISIVDRPANKLCLFNMLKGGTFIKMAQVIKGLPDVMVQEGVVMLGPDVVLDDELMKPVPKPKAGESQKEFVNRCVPIMAAKDPDRPHKQIVAMCYSAYRRAKKDEDRDPLEQAIYPVLYAALEDKGLIEMWDNVQVVGKNDSVPCDWADLYDLVLRPRPITWVTSGTDATVKVDEDVDVSSPDYSAEESTEKDNGEDIVEDEKITNDVDKKDDESTDETQKGLGVEFAAAIAQLGKTLEDVMGRLDAIEVKVTKAYGEEASADDESETKADEAEEKETEIKADEDETKADEDESTEEKKADEAKPDIKKMIQDLLGEELAKIAGGQTTEKKSVAASTKTDTVSKKDDPLAMSLEDLSKVPFSRLEKMIQ
jgi:HK97 family phage prohead protease